MKKPKKWTNPVKNQPAKESTLDIKGDFGKFTDLMRRVVNKREEKPKTTSASRAPVS